MKDEPPIMGPDLMQGQGQGAPVANMNMAGLQAARGMMMPGQGQPGMQGMREERIEEMHEGGYE